MSTMKMPGGNNPLMLGGLLLAGLWLYTRTANARAASLSVPNRGLVSPGRVQTRPYATPTAVAGQLAGGVNALIRGLLPAAAKGITVDTKGIALGDTTSRDALRAAEVASNPGYYGWTGPTLGKVETTAGSDGSFYPYVDGLPVAAVYDPSDYDQANWNYWGIE